MSTAMPESRFSQQSKLLGTAVGILRDYYNVCRCHRSWKNYQCEGLGACEICEEAEKLFAKMKTEETSVAAY